MKRVARQTRNEPRRGGKGAKNRSTPLSALMRAVRIFRALFDEVVGHLSFAAVAFHSETASLGNKRKLLGQMDGAQIQDSWHKGC